MKKNVSLIILALILSCSPRDSEAKVKASNLAGRWFSTNPSELSQQIDNLLEKAPITRFNNPIIIIVPHAGYIYSGKTAAAAYRIVGQKGKSSLKTSLIVIIGPSHFSSFSGCALIDADYYETPLGKIKINQEIAEKLAGDQNFNKNPLAFELEHSIEIQLPFLQRIFGSRLAGDIRILPVLVGDMDGASIQKSARRLAEVTASHNPLFIISSDFTHYGPNFGYEPFGRSGGQGTLAKIRDLDNGAINAIEKKDLEAFTAYIAKTGATICGRNPIRMALALPVAGYEVKRIAYDTSGNITGDNVNSVSYAAIAISGRIQAPAFGEEKTPLLGKNEREFLLKAARDNIASWVNKRRGVRFFPTDVPAPLLEKRGVFITLKKKGELRGCIGYPLGIKSIIESVLECSYHAAFRDPRFEPITADELPAITIEISVLTEPALVKNVAEIQVGRDGLIIEQGYSRGLLLPQVPIEQGWDRKTFLEQTCIKAGLPPGAWRESSTKIYRFQAFVFGEEKQEKKRKEQK